MENEIAAGTILIEEGTHLPDSVVFQREHASDGWLSVKSARSALEKEVEEAGWTFFYMAGEINTTVFGFDKQKTMRAALKRLLASVKAQKCNSVQITGVAHRAFLKVPYVSVSAHARHLQKGLVFREAINLSPATALDMAIQPDRDPAHFLADSI